MPSQKDSIKKWLKKNDYDRAWLAEQCGVSKRTVDDWLSTSRQIPAKATLAIQRLMGKTIEEYSLNEEEQQQIFLNVIASRLEEMMRKTEAELFHDFTLEELEKAKDAAKKQGLTPKEYLIISTIQKASQFINDANKNDGVYDSLKKWQNTRLDEEE